MFSYECLVLMYVRNLEEAFELRHQTVLTFRIYTR